MIISDKDPFRLEVVQNGEDLLEFIIELIMEEKILIIFSHYARKLLLNVQEQMLI